MNKILIDLTTARQVLEALNSFPHRHLTPFISDTRTALQEALAQPQQEPVAWAIFTNAGNARMWSTFQPHLQKLADAEGLTITPLYTSPPARKPLTDAQINAFFEGMEPNNGFWLSFARAIEAAHGIKGDT
jgi:hypothetical protein